MQQSVQYFLLSHLSQTQTNRNKITGDPTFSCKLCGGMPGKFNEFKDSVG
jgi:hypothetical protein